MGAGRRALGKTTDLQVLFVPSVFCVVVRRRTRVRHVSVPDQGIEFQRIVALDLKRG